jgi:hypothetical protein
MLHCAYFYKEIKYMPTYPPFSEALSLGCLGWDIKNIVVRFVFVVTVVESIIILPRRRSSRGPSPRVSGIAGAHDDLLQALER